MAQVHEVKQGECLSSIARRFGFRDWKKIYQHPMNADLRQKRPNPNVLHPGDRIFISEDRLVAMDSTIERLTRPWERLLGFTALGAQTIQTVQRFPKGLNNSF